MLVLITLYAVSVEMADAFVRALRCGGEWHTLARQLAPALIGTDALVRQPSSLPPFLRGAAQFIICLDFWASQDSFERAHRQGVCQALDRSRRGLAQSVLPFGAFSFPSQIRIENPTSAKAPRN